MRSLLTLLTLASLFFGTAVAQDAPQLPAPQPYSPPPSFAVPAQPPGILNHYQFAQFFEPTAGRHHVTIIHPGTGTPVHVSFSLPHGKPQVRTYARRIIFDYGDVMVEIYFAWFGLVNVHTIPRELG